MSRPKTQNLTMRIVAHQHLYRWNIGPALRQAGFRAVDLWAGPGPALSLDDWRALGFDGHVVPGLCQRVKPIGANRPMGIAEAQAAARALNRAAHDIMAARRSGTAQAALRPATTPAAARRMITINDVMDRFIADRSRPGPDQVAPNRVKSYRTARRLISPWIGHEPPRIIDKELLVQRFWKWRDENGHHMALKAVQFLAAALGHCHGRDPFDDHVMPPMAAYRNLRLPKGPARLRVGLPEEMDALLLAFDDPARLYATLDTPLADRVLTPAPSMGDALITMLWTCARVEDALRLARGHRITLDGRAMLRYRLAKNSWRQEKLVTIPELGPLAARLPSMDARSRSFRHPSDALIIDERHGAPYVQTRTDGGTHHNRFEKRWNQYRALAGQVVPSLLGHGTDPLGRPWLAFRAQDCRDTAATRIYRATGGDLEKLSHYHGSTASALADLMRHYIEIDPRAAAEVGDELAAYAARSGITA